MLHWWNDRNIGLILIAGFLVVIAIFSSAIVTIFLLNGQVQKLETYKTDTLVPLRSDANQAIIWFRSADDDGAYAVMAPTIASATSFHDLYLADIANVRTHIAGANERLNTAGERVALDRFTTALGDETQDISSKTKTPSIGVFGVTRKVPGKRTSPSRPNRSPNHCKAFCPMSKLRSRQPISAPSNSPESRTSSASGSASRRS